MSGGLGNQMFQYSFGYALSKKANIPIKYDFSFYKEENIKDIIQNNYNYIVISEKNFKKYLKNNFYCDQSLIKKKNSYVKTRNPLNKKPFELIYLFKLECLEF